MIWLDRALTVLLMLFCHMAGADQSGEVLSIEVAIEAETESQHLPEEEYGDSLLQKPFLAHSEVYVDGAQEEETDDSYDDQDVDDEATEESDDGF